MKEMLRYLTICLISFLVLTSCTPVKKEVALKEEEQVEKALSPFDEKFDEVMEVHDAAMGKMGTISMKTRSIKLMVDSLSQLSITENAELIQKLSKVNQDLSQADDGMMNWMRNFKNPEDASEEAKINYLNAEMEKITVVNDAIDHALKAADSYLEQ